MRLQQRIWSTSGGWTVERTQPGFETPQLVLAFGAPAALHDPLAMAGLRQEYPGAHVMGCSTAGEICDTSVLDGTIVATAIQFEHTRVDVAQACLTDACDSAQVGEALARRLAPQGLVHVFVLAEGLKVNGSELVAGLRRGLPRTSRSPEAWRATAIALSKRSCASTTFPAKASWPWWACTAIISGLATVRSAGGTTSVPNASSRARWATCSTSSTARRAGSRSLQALSRRSRPQSSGERPLLPAQPARPGREPRRGPHHPVDRRGRPQPDIRRRHPAGRFRAPHEGQCRPAHRRVPRRPPA